VRRSRETAKYAGKLSISSGNFYQKISLELSEKGVLRMLGGTCMEVETPEAKGKQK